MKRLGTIGQWIGLILFVAAILYVLLDQGATGNVLLALGAFCFTLGTKAVYYKKRSRMGAKITIRQLVEGEPSMNRRGGE